MIRARQSAMFFTRYDFNLLLVAVAALSAALAFVSALHLYARRYLRPRRSGSTVLGAGFPDHLVEYPPVDFTLHHVHGSGTDAAAFGLDAKALRALPVFTWESNKQAGAPAEPVRCTVCLGQMVDGELGRLLPACRHVFHIECIDKWLGMSTTCPVCRTTAAEAAAADAPPGGEEAQPRAAAAEW